LTNTWPARIARASLSCRAPSRVQMPATSPKSVPLASFTACASSSNGIAASTGPNTSSRASRDAAGTSRTSVGAT
jgi:hypothetical protein